MNAPLAGIGHNGGPTTFEAFAAAVDDLISEASAVLTGVEVETEEQAEAVTALLTQCKRVAADIEAARKAEVAPYDDAKAAIQARYNTLIGDTKSARGKLVLLRKSIDDVLTGFRTRQAEAKRKAAEAARIEAEAKELAAREAMQASRGDLEARMEAEALVEQAKAAAKVAARADKAATTGNGLRTSYEAQVLDYLEFGRWAWKHHPDDYHEFLNTLANRLVRNGARDLPGVEAVPVRRAI